MKLENYIGQRKGRLVLFEISESREKNSLRKGKFRCDCGKIKNIRINHVFAANVASCGCLNSELASKRRKVDIQISGAKRLLYTYKKAARERKLIFEITDEKFNSLVLQNCHYCGSKPSTKLEPRSKHYKGEFLYNGVDRINSSFGYITSNVVSCCTTCNYAKRVMSTEQFLEWIKSVYNHSIKQLQ